MILRKILTSSIKNRNSFNIFYFTKELKKEWKFCIYKNNVLLLNNYFKLFHNNFKTFIFKNFQQNNNNNLNTSSSISNNNINNPQTNKLILGMESIITIGESISLTNQLPNIPYAVLFEDDQKTGQFYILEKNENNQNKIQIIHSFLIYQIEEIQNKELPIKLQIIWSDSTGKQVNI